MCLGLHVKHPLFLSYFEFSGQIFEKYSKIKANQNPLRVSRDVACERTDGQTYRQRDMTKLIVAFFLQFLRTLLKNEGGTAENTGIEDITRVSETKDFEIFTFHNVLRGTACWTGHVTFMGEMRNSFEALVSNREWKRAHVTGGCEVWICASHPKGRRKLRRRRRRRRRLLDILKESRGYIHIYLRTYIHTYTHTHTYIHTHIHTYIRTHTHTHTYIHTYIPTYIHTYIHTHTPTYTYIHTYIHTYTHIHIYIHTQTHIHTHTYSYIHTYIYIYIYTHTHTHIHIHSMDPQPKCHNDSMMWNKS